MKKIIMPSLEVLQEEESSQEPSHEEKMLFGPTQKVSAARKPITEEKKVEDVDMLGPTQVVGKSNAKPTVSKIKKKVMDPFGPT